MRFGIAFKAEGGIGFIEYNNEEFANSYSLISQFEDGFEDELKRSELIVAYLVMEDENSVNMKTLHQVDTEIDLPEEVYIHDLVEFNDIAEQLIINFKAYNGEHYGMTIH